MGQRAVIAALARQGHPLIAEVAPGAYAKREAAFATQPTVGHWEQQALRDKLRERGR